MGLCRIEIEQTGAERWTVEMEAGHGWRFKSQRFNATSFDDLMDKVIEAYQAAVPVEPAPPPRVPDQPLAPFPVTQPTRVPRQRRQQRGSRGQML